MRHELQLLNLFQENGAAKSAFIPNLLEIIDSKGIRDYEEEEDVGALGAAVFFGNFELIPLYDLRTNQTIRSRVRNGMMIFLSFHSTK